MWLAKAAGVVRDFAIEVVTLDVLQHLERRRRGIVNDIGKVRAEVSYALEPVRAAYRESELPPAYLSALEREISETVPERWCAGAARLTDLEDRDFELWRGGDLIARLTYVVIALAVAQLSVAAGLVEPWLRWVVTLLALAAWWLPSIQVAFHRQAYARSLRQIAQDLTAAQQRIERELIDPLGPTLIDAESALDRLDE